MYIHIRTVNELCKKKRINRTKPSSTTQLQELPAVVRMGLEQFGLNSEDNFGHPGNFVPLHKI